MEPNGLFRTRLLMNLPMIDQNLLAKDGYNDLNLILDLVIVNRERAKYIGLALDVLDTIQVNVENQVNDKNHGRTGSSVISGPVSYGDGIQIGNSGSRIPDILF